MQKDFTVLILEDDESLAELIKNYLERDNINCNLINEQNVFEIISQFQNHNGLLILDYKLTQYSGKEIVLMLNEKGLNIPFIIITGNGDEKIAVEMMKLGAIDYIVKDNAFLKLLPSIVNKTYLQILKEKKLIEAQRAIKENEKKWKAIFHNSNDGLLLISNNNIIDYNLKIIELLEINSQIFNLADFANIFKRNEYRELLKFLQLNDLTLHYNKELLITTFSNNQYFFEIIITKFEDNGNIVNFLEFRNIDKKKKADLALLEAKEILEITQNSVNNATDSIFWLEAKGNFVYTNNATIDMLEYSKEELLKMNIFDIDSAFSENLWRNYWTDSKKEIIRFESIYKTKTGKEIAVDVSINNFKIEKYDYYFVFARDISKLKQLEREMLNIVIETEEKERKRFSEDLHDGLGPLLSSIKIYLKLFDSENHTPEKRKEYLNYANELINDAIQTTRAIANNLMPNVLNDFGLIKALNSFTEKINLSKAIKINFCAKEFPTRLDNTTEIIIYRVVLELINNTIKHSNAKNINILVKLKTEELIILFEDDGMGFDYNNIIKTEKSSGLKNISNRIKSINGKIIFSSLTNFGTKVNISIPI